MTLTSICDSTVAPPTAREFEEIWARHGDSAYRLACVLLGDERAAAEAVRLAMVDLADSVGGVPMAAAGQLLARFVYQRSQALDVLPSASAQLPPIMAWISQLATVQRASLALCVFGGFSHREAASLLGVPPAVVAELLTAGLRELGRMAAGARPASA